MAKSIFTFLQPVLPMNEIASPFFPALPTIFGQGIYNRMTHHIAIQTICQSFRSIVIVGVESLASAIKQVANNHEMRQKATELGQTIRDEDGVSHAVKIIQKIIATDKSVV